MSHYTDVSERPSPESKYAFLLMSFAILDSEPSFPLWHPPLELREDMDPIARAYCERCNEYLRPSMSASGLQLLSCCGRQGFHRPA